MLIPFNFNIQEVQHKAYLEPTNSLSEKTISIEGRHYKILGNKEDVSLLKKYFASLESIHFDSMGSFQASLEKVGPYEKTHSVFQKTIVSSLKAEIEERLVDIHSLREELEKSLPSSAGAMVVIYEQGKQLPPICIGQTSQESSQPVNMQTAALIGSGAKMFTALLSQILCEKGFLPLGTKLSDVLTEEQFHIFKNPELAKDITVEMLLSHTSGLQFFADDHNNSRKGQSLDEILKGMQPEGIRFIAAPGDRIYSYSNQIGLAAVFIEQTYKRKMEPQRQELQKKIEKAEKHIAYLKNKKDHAGGDRVKKNALNTQIEVHEQRLKKLKSDLNKIPSNYADIMKSELLDPLGMRRTSFDKPKDRNVLRAYRKGNSFDAEILDPLMRGAGGLWSCMEDMTKLTEAYRQNGLVTSSGKTLISKEGLQNMAHVRGLNGNTGLGVNVEGSIVGKGGTVFSYAFTMKMDPSKGNAVISLCNFKDEKPNFESFSKTVHSVLDVMHPNKEVQKKSQPELTEEESSLVKKGFPMSKCDYFFKGDRGFVGLKRIDEEPGIRLNWNGQTLPIRKLEENRYLILDNGYPGGQILEIFKKGEATGKIYVIIEKEGETSAFQEIANSEMFFSKDTSFLEDIAEARGTYVSTLKEGPTFQFDIETPNCQIVLNKFPPATALVTKVEKDENQKTKEVFLQGNCGDSPPDKLFKISRGDVVQNEWSKELTNKELELESQKKQSASSEKIISLKEQIEELQKQLSTQKDIAWFFRVADFVNPDHNYEAIPLTRPLESIEIEKQEKSEEGETFGR